MRPLWAQWNRPQVKLTTTLVKRRIHYKNHSLPVALPILPPPPPPLTVPLFLHGRMDGIIIIMVSGVLWEVANYRLAIFAR